jgi:prevent-host-death family protein
MMKTVGAYEAKTHLPRLLDEVASGETITITKHGVPVAQLVPMPENERPDVGKAIDEWLEYRRQHNITLGPDLTIRDLIEEGRRY